jgi:hypothetical protein
MPTFAGQMTQTPTANPQWHACDGSTFNSQAPPPFPARPATAPSTGTYRDYFRNVGYWSGGLGIGGWLVQLPNDPSGTWYISMADDSSEATIPNAPTPIQPPAWHTAPPVNVNAPFVTQAGNGLGSTLNCTMGNWNNVPSSYAYQWRVAGANVGTNNPNYTVLVGNVGDTAVCIVTATNAGGSAVQQSNSVTVT